MKYVSIFALILFFGSCKNKIDSQGDFHEMTAVKPLLTLASGNVLRFEKFPSDFVHARNVDVWLPDNYKKNKKYAVLYMHDGQMLFDSTTTWNKQEWGVDETVSKLLKAQKIKNCIIVGVWNISAYRHTDYFPNKPFLSLNKPKQDSILSSAKSQKLMIENIQSDNYLKFIVTELKPFIDRNFSTLSDSANTFVVGSSMGGLISMYAISEYPNIFGGAACLSTHWIGTFTNQNNPIPDAFLRYMEDNLPNAKTHKLYFDYGTQTLDSLYLPYQNRITQILKIKGYSTNIKFEGHDHSENSWKERLHIPLEFLLQN
ncbi:MAG: esterase [Bacteroidetes bacterium HGW-Bacteroidetes-13]|nr:MAG: esterase [Bacteroidetes bacterium HGW-Bacteroidetes-13]